MVPFYGCSSTVSRLQSHCEETVYVLTLGPYDFLVLIKLALEGWKAELTFDLPSGFEPWILLDRESNTLTTGHCSVRLTRLLFIWEKLFNFSNIQLQQQIHFLHNPFFIHPAIYEMPLLFSNNWAKQKWLFATFRTKKSSQVAWFNSTRSFNTCTFISHSNVRPFFSMLCFSWSVNIARFMERQ